MRAIPLARLLPAIVAVTVLLSTPVTGALTCRRPVFRATFDGIPAAINEPFSNAHGTGDFNGDGLIDVVVAGTRFNEDIRTPVRFLLNDGRGGFADGTSAVMASAVPSLYNPRRLIVADFNGDGRPDVFIGAHGVDFRLTGERNKLLLSTTDGRLTDASSRLPQLDDFTHGVAAADIDDDGDLDILVGNFLGVGRSTLPYLLVNDGTGRFSKNTSRLPPGELAFSADRGPMGAVLVVDLNGDGAPDMVVGDHGARPSRIYLNDGRGSFRDSPPLTLPQDRIAGAPVNTVDVVTLDVNGDGAPDLLLSNVGAPAPGYLGRNIQVLVNRGATFTDETAERMPASRLGAVRHEWFAFLEVLDFDDDGDLDVLVKSVVTGGPTPDASTPYVFLNNGRGRFDPLAAGIFGSLIGYLGPLERVDLRGNVKEPVGISNVEERLGFAGALPSVGDLLWDRQALFIRRPRRSCCRAIIAK